MAPSYVVTPGCLPVYVCACLFASPIVLHRHVLFRHASGKKARRGESGVVCPSVGAGAEVFVKTVSANKSCEEQHSVVIKFAVTSLDFTNE